MEGTFKVQLVQDDNNSIVVKTTDEKAFDYLNISNERGLLRIDVDRKPFDFSKVTLNISFKELESLEIKGGMTLDTKGYLDLGDLFVLVKGGARIDLKVKAEGIDVISEGGVLFDLSGVGESLDVKIYGAGHIDAGELKTKNVNFTLEGVGTGVVHATHTLDAEIKGAGKLKYRGNPRINKRIEGLGSVEKE